MCIAWGLDCARKIMRIFGLASFRPPQATKGRSSPVGPTRYARAIRDVMPRDYNLRFLPILVKRISRNPNIRSQTGDVCT